MERSEILEVVLEAMRGLNMARPADEQMVVSETAAIFGAGSPLDSLGLVALLMDIEEGFRQNGHAVLLSDERAMSQSRSPFRNVPRLVEYISDLFGEGPTTATGGN
jgi:acyl carrier protein